MAKEPSSAAKTSSAGKEGKAGSASKDGKKDSTVASPSSTPTKSPSVSSKASTPDSKKSTPPSSASPEKGKKEEAKPKSASGKKEEKEAKKAENGEKKEEVVKVSGDSNGKEAESRADTKAEKDPLLAEPSVPVRLTYFDGAGRAELIRLVLAVGNMDYEDRRIGSEQWARIKTDTPFSQLPLLEFHGKRLGQSLAIARFLAGKADIYGADEMERAQIDAIVDYVSDYNNKWLTVFRADSFEEKVDIISNIFVNFIPTFFGNVQSLLRDAGGQFFVGNKLSLADLAVFLIFHSFSNPDDPFFATLPYVDERIGMLDDRYPPLNEHMIRIYNVPEVKGWMTRRPLGLF